MPILAKEGMPSDMDRDLVHLFPIALLAASAPLTFVLIYLPFILVAQAIGTCWESTKDFKEGRPL